MAKISLGLLLLLAIPAVPFVHEAVAFASESPEAPRVDEAAINARVDARLRSVLRELAKKTQAGQAPLVSSTH